MEGALNLLCPAAVLAEASVPQDGAILPLLKVVVMAVLIAPWLHFAPWVDKDSRAIFAQGYWPAAFLGAGAAGVLLWLLIPMYAVGILIYVIIAGAAMGTYVAQRNGKVPQRQKVLTAEHLSSIFSRKPKEEVQVATRLTLYDSHDKIVHPPVSPQASAAQRTTYNLAQDLLYDLLWRRASEADVSPSGQKVRVRFAINGVVVERQAIPLQQSEAIIQYLKSVAGLDVQERRRPQQGKFSVDMAGTPINVIVTTTGTTDGQRMQFRVLQEVVRTKLDELGMSEDVLARVRELNRAGKGLIIVSAPQRNGVTSTLYSMLREQDAFIKQLVTLETTPVVDLENITQHTYGEPGKLAGALTSVLRREPDVIMVDQCEDPAVASIMRQAAADKLVLLGAGAADSFTALARWVKVCGKGADAVQSLRAVLCQVLVRKLCTQCREAYRPDPQFLAKANIPAENVDRFYRPPSKPALDENGQPTVCAACQGSGYLGRIGVFELLDVTDEIAQLIAADAPVAQIKTVSRKAKMLYIQEQALRKVLEGVTSVQEVIRVTQQGKKP